MLQDLLLLVNAHLIKVAGGFLTRVRFAGISATLGRGRRAPMASPQREPIATSPARACSLPRRLPGAGSKNHGQ